MGSTSILTLIYIFIAFPVFTQYHSDNITHRYFIENKGQWPDEVLYLARIDDLYTWITRDGAVYSQFSRDDTRLSDSTVRFRYVHAMPNIQAISNGEKSGYFNYYIGNNPEGWSTYVGLYDEVMIKGIYEGIHMRYYFDRGLLRYDYIVEPGAEVDRIVIALEGEKNVRVNDRGELIAATAAGEFRHVDLFAYQMSGREKREVQCNYKIRDDGFIGLDVPDYDREQVLIIDPLVYSTFFGGSQTDEGWSIAFDREGNMYLTGRTGSPDFPATNGGYDGERHAKTIAFVTKLSAGTYEPIYTTFIGGTDDDTGYSITVDEDGYAYVSGCSYSPDFPTTEGALSRELSSLYDVFISKLNPTGSELVYSTYVGGSGLDAGWSIAVDDEGNAFVTGFTTSSDFPTTIGTFDETHNGGVDAFAAKLNADGSGLIYSTFLGGSGGDRGREIVLDAAGNAYIAGITGSPEFPVTGGAYSTAHNGEVDVFVSKLNNDGSELIYSTFLGGSDRDESFSIAVDDQGNTFVTGFTTSPDFPVTSGAFSEIRNGAESAFVTKLNAAGTSLVYSTFLGGSGRERGLAIDIDQAGNAYVTGFTSSVDFPVTGDAYDENFNGEEDAFISVLNANGSGLAYSTYLGGSERDRGLSISAHDNVYVYVTGYTLSGNFPVTDDALDETHNGAEDVFIAKLDLVTTSVDDISQDRPEHFRLYQNFPNPFNSSTTIRFDLPVTSGISLKIYNIFGQEITTLIKTIKPWGSYEVVWDADNVASGMYYYKLDAGENTAVRALMLLK